MPAREKRGRFLGRGAGRTRVWERRADPPDRVALSIAWRYYAQGNSLSNSHLADAKAPVSAPSRAASACSWEQKFGDPERLGMGKGILVWCTLVSILRAVGAASHLVP